MATIIPPAHTNFQRRRGRFESKLSGAGGAPCIELDGNRSIVITGRCVIALYSREEMRIRCGRLLVQITGSELELGTLDEQELSITGLIAQVGFLTEGA